MSNEARIKPNPEEARKLLKTLPGTPALYYKLADEFLKVQSLRAYPHYRAR